MSAVLHIDAVVLHNEHRMHRWTSTLGPLIDGIWGRYADTNDVNTVDVAGPLGKPLLSISNCTLSIPSSEQSPEVF